MAIFRPKIEAAVCSDTVVFLANYTSYRTLIFGLTHLVTSTYSASNRLQNFLNVHNP